MVEAYAGPDEGVQNMKASEWVGPGGNHVNRWEGHDRFTKVLRIYFPGQQVCRMPLLC